jgi:small-conductance mechanosensitive channel
MISESKALMIQLLPNVNKTVISMVIVALCTLVVYLLFSNKADTKKHRSIIRKRFIYVMLILDILIITKIWVDGFEHIMTVFSLMAAGLVVANKESVMNLIGGLIISWRDLFVEGDFIQIQHYSGYVFSIGIMSFRLYETVSIDKKYATGRTIKIPNSLIITSPVVNFSPDSNLSLHKFFIQCKDERTLAGQLKQVLETIVTIIHHTYKDNPCYKKAYVKSHNRELSHLIDLEPKVFLEQWVDKEVHLRIVVQFYCFSQDHEQIAQQFWLRMD